MKIRQDMQTARKSLSLLCPQHHDAVDDATVKCRIRLSPCGMHAHDMVEQRTRCRLSALDQPVIRQNSLPVGSPQAATMHAIGRQRHKATGCASDERDVVFHMVVEASAKRTKRARIGIDHAGRDPALRL